MVKHLIQVTACPLCGAALQESPATTHDTVVEKGVAIVGRPLPTVPRETIIAACTGCEFVIDLRNPNGVPKTSAQLLHDVGVLVREKAAH